MCLYITKGPLVAKKDIKVYKKLNFKLEYGISQDLIYFESPYKATRYYPNGHIYSKIKKCYNEIENGIHAFIFNKSFVGEIFGDRVVMWIPKGATYYLGEFNEIVSTDLIWYPEKSIWCKTKQKYVNLDIWLKSKGFKLTKNCSKFYEKGRNIR